MTHQDIHATFWEHVEELRKTLIYTFCFIILGMCICVAYQDPLISILTSPLQQLERFEHEGNPLKKEQIQIERIHNIGDQPVRYQNTELAPGSYIDREKALPTMRLTLLSPVEGFLAALKIAFYFGLLLTSPLWGFMILKFVSPALKGYEKKIALPFLALSLLFICLGMSGAYFITIPIANEYFFNFNHSIGLNLWSMSSYLDYTFLLMFSHGIVAECGLILFTCVHYGWITAEQMIPMRRYVIVATFILGALVTPPDVLSQVIVAIPLIIFYELGILYARFRFLSI